MAWLVWECAIVSVGVFDFHVFHLKVSFNQSEDSSVLELL